MKKHTSRRGFISNVAAGAAVMAAPPRIVAKSASAVQQSSQNDIIGITGTQFSDRPYFPMLLGNGIDHVLIGYSGAMASCSGHEHWYFNTIMTGWFKSDRKLSPSHPLMNLLQCSFIIRQGIHADSVDASEQTFDCDTGVLLTSCHYAHAEMQVKTFLTDDHLLIHRFSVETDEKDMWIQFFVKDPAIRRTPSLVLDPNESSFSQTEKDRCIAFTLQSEGLNNGGGRIFTDHQEAQRVTCYNSQLGIQAPLTGTTDVSFVVECIDAEDREDGTARNQPVDNFHYASALQRHTEGWQQYDAKSTVQLSRQPLQDIYRMSLYTIRAHQHPSKGGISVGEYPEMWTGGMNSYDTSFGFMALLSANRLSEAEKVVAGWQRLLPVMRKKTQEYGLPGAAFPAPITQNGGFTKKYQDATRESFLEMRHFITANIAIHAWQLYQYTGQLRILKEYWDCLSEPVAFLLGACVNEYENHAEIIRSSGPNGKERIDGKVVYNPNPIRSIMTTVEAVSAIREAAKLLGKTPDPEWDRLLPKLKRGIQANRFGGVIRSNRTPDSRPGDLAYAGLFNCPVDENTIRAEVQHLSGPTGLIRWQGHGYSVVPWMHCKLSAAYSRLGLPEAAEVLEQGAQFTTTLGAFPEAVRPDGVYWKTWYPSVHGSYIQAMNLLLVRSHEDVVELFPGLPEEWGDASFASLRVPFGLLVSASRSNGEISGEITNGSDQTQDIRIRAFSENAWEKSMTLEPGQKVSL
jgi:hypothetical protein